MKSRQFHLHDGQSGAAITVHVIPRSSRIEISEIQDDGTVVIRMTAFPDETAANQALLNYLAGVLAIKASQLEIVAGISGNDKLITILDLDKEAVQARILKHIA